MDKKFDWKPESALGKRLKFFDVIEGSGLVKSAGERAMHRYLTFVARAINRHPEVRDDFLSGLSRDVDNEVRSIQPEDQDDWQGLHAQVVALNFYLIRRVNGLPLPPK